jgi:hypothetical protein
VSPDDEITGLLSLVVGLLLVIIPAVVEDGRGFDPAPGLDPGPGRTAHPGSSVFLPRLKSRVLGRRPRTILMRTPQTRTRDAKATVRVRGRRAPGNRPHRGQESPSPKGFSGTSVVHIEYLSGKGTSRPVSRHQVRGKSAI